MGGGASSIVALREYCYTDALVQVTSFGEGMRFSNKGSTSRHWQFNATAERFKVQVLRRLRKDGSQSRDRTSALVTEEVELPNQLFAVLHLDGSKTKQEAGCPNLFCMM